MTKNDTIAGFDWRGGCEIVTTGIYIWSKPFIRVNQSGEEVRPTIKFQCYDFIKIVCLFFFSSEVFFHLVTLPFSVNGSKF